MPQLRVLILAAYALLVTSAGLSAGPTLLAGSEWGLGKQDQRYVQFASGGKVSGNAGCNRFFSTYQQDGNLLKIAEIATTRKLCSEAEMKLEAEWLDLLAKVRSIELTHLKLVLFGENNAQLAELKRREFD